MHKTDIERYIIIRSHRVMQQNSNKTDPHIGRSLLFIVIILDYLVYMNLFCSSINYDICVLARLLSAREWGECLLEPVDFYSQVRDVLINPIKYFL